MKSLRNISQIVPPEIWIIILTHLSLIDYYNLCLVYYINESTFKFLIEWAKGYYPRYAVMTFYVILNRDPNKQIRLISKPCVVRIPLEGLLKFIKIKCKCVYRNNKSYYKPHIIMRRDGFPQITQVSTELDNFIRYKGSYHLESFCLLNYYQMNTGISALYGHDEISFYEGHPVATQFWKNGILISQQPYEVNKIYNKNILDYNMGLFECDDDVTINIPIEKIYGGDPLQKIYKQRGRKLQIYLTFVFVLMMCMFIALMIPFFFLF